MTTYTLTDLAPQILLVLVNAHTGKGTQPQHLTSYQILNRLPTDWRTWLQATYGPSGKASGTKDSAASRVAHIAVGLAHEQKVEVTYFDNRGVKFEVEGEGDVQAGYPTCALFRAI